MIKYVYLRKMLYLVGIVDKYLVVDSLPPMLPIVLPPF